MGCTYLCKLWVAWFPLLKQRETAPSDRSWILFCCYSNRVTNSFIFRLPADVWATGVLVALMSSMQYPFAHTGQETVLCLQILACSYCSALRNCLGTWNAQDFQIAGSILKALGQIPAETALTYKWTVPLVNMGSQFEAAQDIVHAFVKCLVYFFMSLFMPVFFKGFPMNLPAKLWQVFVFWKAVL